MAINTIVNNIETLLLAVSGIGKVHSFLRYSNNSKSFFDIFKTSNDKINACQITRRSVSEETVAQGYVAKYHTMVIVAYYALNDANETEATFQTLLDNISTKIRENHTLSGAVVTSNDITVEEITHEMLSNVLCHKAIITFVAEEHEIYTTS